jgi:myo-inositol-1(or 4)-monophosphatase
MNVTIEAPSPLLAQLTEAAEQAGHIALDWFRPGAQTSARIDSKEGGSPVTEADHAVDAFLRDTLPPLMPQAAWLSEETEDDARRLSSDHVIIVDPIDGTRAFLGGDPRWGVCIALVSHGRPVMGVIHMPALHQTFVAEQGLGAFRNGQRIRASERADLTGASVAGPASLIKSLSEDGLNLVFEPKIPSLAYRFARVAEGSLDAGLASTNACDWDIAAADIILLEAGGRVSDLDGRPPAYNRPVVRHSILGAAPDQLHAQFTAALRRAVRPTGK